MSGWEIATKTALGRLRPSRSVAQAIIDSGFEELPLRLRHAESFARLVPHHRDPFDRMLIVQAEVERLTIVTRDVAFDAYEVPVLRA